MTTPVPALLKFGFRIRTRNGLAVDNLAVQARDRDEAERKIARMYPHCEITECRELQAAARDEGYDIGDIISLISQQSGGGTSGER